MTMIGRAISGSILIASLTLAACGGSGAQMAAMPGSAPFAGMNSFGQQSSPTSYVFVSDSYSSAVREYAADPQDPGPLETITQGIGCPDGLAIDAAGTLYVANQCNATVTEYPAGSLSPSVTLSQGLPVPGFEAIDPNGNLWVTNAECPGNVVEFVPGNPSPVKTITKGINCPEGIAFDAAGNMYVATQPRTQALVAVYPPGQDHPSAFIGRGILIAPHGVSIDPSGNIIVADYWRARFFIFAPQTYKLIRKSDISHLACDPGGTALDTVNERLYIACTDIGNVAEYGEYGFGSERGARIRNYLQYAADVAVSPPLLPRHFSHAH